MVDVEASRDVLRAIADSYPAQGVVVGVNLRPGFGDGVMVDVFTCREPRSGLSVDHNGRDLLRKAIAQALDGYRTHVVVLEVEV